jgi:ABC-type polysaccharide/polyol phosphate transport system ATPase subunit
MITADRICKDYHSETRHGWNRVLSGVSFTVSPGDKIAVLGRNGAGKSTLIRLIAGIELPTLGTIDRQMTVSWPVGLTGERQHDRERQYPDDLSHL